MIDPLERQPIGRIDKALVAAIAIAEDVRTLALPTQRMQVTALKACIVNAFALVEALYKLREAAAESDRAGLAETEANELVAGARRTLARTRPHPPE